MDRAARAALLASTLALASCTLFSLDHLQGLDDGGGNSGGDGSGANNSDGGSTSEGAGGGGAGNPDGGNGAGATSSTGGTGTGGGAGYAECILADGPALFFAMSGDQTEPSQGSIGGDGSYGGGHALASPIVSGGDDAHTFDQASTPGQLSFDGASPIFGGFSPFSIEMWVRIPSPVPTDELFRFSSGLDRLTLEIQSGVSGGEDSFRFRYRTTAGDERYSIHYLELDDAPAEVHHVVAVYRQTAETIFDGSGTADDLLIYVDGTLVEPSGFGDPVPMFTVTGQLLIGGGFTGAIDDLAVYSRELSAAEVLEHFEIGGGDQPCIP